jgi:hypothetical protein
MIIDGEIQKVKEGAGRWLTDTLLRLLSKLVSVCYTMLEASGMGEMRVRWLVKQLRARWSTFSNGLLDRPLDHLRGSSIGV